MNVLLNNLIEFLYPHYCNYCLKKGQIICANCFNNNLNKNIVQRCFVCDREVRHGFIHKDCKEVSFLDGLLYTCIYDKAVKKIIRDAKYSGIYSHMKDLGLIMSQYYRNYSFSPDLITFVPMYKQKRQKRGFNQAENLALAFCSYSNLEHKRLLNRTKNTNTQVGMDSLKRATNLKNAFQVIDKNIIKSTTILIIDDVFTSGSTLNECAKELKACGAEKVVGFTFAKAGLKTS